MRLGFYMFIDAQYESKQHNLWTIEQCCSYIFLRIGHLSKTKNTKGHFGRDQKKLSDILYSGEHFCSLFWITSQVWALKRTFNKFKNGFPNSSQFLTYFKEETHIKLDLLTIGQSPTSFVFYRKIFPLSLLTKGVLIPIIPFQKGSQHLQR